MGILQAGILEWVTISFSRASSQSRDGTWVSHFAGRFFTIWATREDPWGRRTTAIHRNKSGKTGEKKWDSHLLFTVFKQAKWHLPTWRVFFSLALYWRISETSTLTRGQKIRLESKARIKPVLRVQWGGGTADVFLQGQVYPRMPMSSLEDPLPPWDSPSSTWRECNFSS